MMDVLMYLFETYIYSDIELEIDQDALEKELLDAGFGMKEIYKALDWLEDLAQLQDPTTNTFAFRQDCTHSAMRIYAQQEMERLTPKHRGFILFLEQSKVLSPEMREVVIDRVMQLETTRLKMDDLKWVILMVLFNTPGHEQAYTQLEEFLYSKEQGFLH